MGNDQKKCKILLKNALICYICIVNVLQIIATRTAQNILMIKSILGLVLRLVTSNFLKNYCIVTI